MRYFKVCPRCGAHLDANETCDCLNVEAELLLAHVGKKEVPAGAANTNEDEVEHVDHIVSASNDTTD